MQGAGRGVVPGGVQRLNLDALARGHIGQPDAATAPASSPGERPARCQHHGESAAQATG